MRLNNTESYHINEMETLGWELTVCNTLEAKNSPILEILKDKDTFGNLLLEHLKKYIPIDNLKNIIEIGGGYGFIMRDILSRYPHLNSLMLDISPFLLEKQKSLLNEYSKIKFLNKNFFETDNSFLEQFDIAILNENIGDFPTIEDIDPVIFDPSNKSDELSLKINKLFNKYLFSVNKSEKFNFNIGAIETLEKLCDSKVKYIYISEHSCEASPGEYISKNLNIEASGNPEKISLKGHNEYTIKFSNLEKVGKYYNYKIIRGSFSDFIKINFTNRINFILTSSSDKDEHEIIRHFIYDINKYEYLLLIK